jgi:hypothetical protein
VSIAGERKKRKKLGKEIILLYSWAIKMRVIFLNFDYIGDYPSGERSKEMHRSGKELKVFLIMYYSTCCLWKFKGGFQVFPLHSNKGPLGDFDPNSTPYFRVNIIVIQIFRI